MLPSLARLSISHLDTEAKRKRDGEYGDVRPVFDILSPLPFEVKLQVLAAFQADDCEALIAICQVNKEFDEMCKDDDLWRSFANDRGWLRSPQFLTQEPPISYRLFYKYICSYGDDERLNSEFDDSIIVAEAKDGNAENVRILLAFGSDVEADDGSPLLYAIKNGHARVVQILLDAGADVNRNNVRVLALASGQGDSTIVKMLIDVLKDRGTEVNADFGEALYTASVLGHSAVVKVFLDKGFYSVLHLYDSLIGSSSKGHVGIVKMLLDAGSGYFDANMLRDALVKAVEGKHVATLAASFGGPEFGDNSAFGDEQARRIAEMPQLPSSDDAAQIQNILLRVVAARRVRYNRSS
jgi:hypothetical protein